VSPVRRISTLRAVFPKSLFLLGVLVACLCFGGTALAQQRESRERAISTSELAKDNLDRVAASDSQITGVLNANPGLFVELKRWVAKDAADRGQVLKDFDLTDAAILSRLTSDVRFRAAATRLLQGYGYLLPKPNPDSVVGREQAAL